MVQEAALPSGGTGTQFTEARPTVLRSQVPGQKKKGQGGTEYGIYSCSNQDTMSVVLIRARRHVPVQGIPGLDGEGQSTSKIETLQIPGCVACASLSSWTAQPWRSRASLCVSVCCRRRLPALTLFLARSLFPSPTSSRDQVAQSQSQSPFCSGIHRVRRSLLAVLFPGNTLFVTLLLFHQLWELLTTLVLSLLSLSACYCHYGHLLARLDSTKLHF